MLKNVGKNYPKNIISSMEQHPEEAVESLLYMDPNGLYQQLSDKRQCFICQYFEADRVVDSETVDEALRLRFRNRNNQPQQLFVKRSELIGRSDKVPQCLGGLGFQLNTIST